METPEGSCSRRDALSCAAMNDTVRFLHTADLHLDSPLKSLAARNAGLADIIAQASRTALRNLVDTALDQSVDALLIAGDLFDGDQRDIKTAMVLQRELRRLHKAAIPVFIIKGNHDAQAQLLGVVDLPDNVHVFDGKGGKSGRCHFANDRAVVHGVSFANRQAPKSLLPKYGKPEPNCFNIGMLHTSLTGADGHNNYAPCTVAELIDMGYDYWALGHIHKRTVHHDRPAIVMPGNPLGRHINESGERTVCLVTLQTNEAPTIESINIAPVQFERLSIDLESLEDQHTAIGHIIERVNLRRAELNVDHLIIRVQLTGSTKLAFNFQRDQHALLEQLQIEYELDDGIWIDSLVVSALTLPESIDNFPGRGQSGVERQLRSLVNAELLATANLREAALDDLIKLTKSLPAELKDIFGNDPESREALLQELLADGGHWMLQQISFPASSTDTEDNKPDAVP